MFRRCWLRLDNIIGDSPSFRSKPWRGHMSTVLHSPYKESFKEYWATPVPWMRREYGPKPKPGDPIPLRDAATLILCGKNNHVDPQLIRDGEENDYKVLMMFREAKGRYTKDQFLIPSKPVVLEDRNEKWPELLQRLGVKTVHEDLPVRICAMRALLGEANILIIPPEGGGIVEVQGPPGLTKKWHAIVHSHPDQLRNLLDILELPMENAFRSMLPFRRIQTPPTEKFRFDNTSYIVTFDKMPCVRYTISTVDEKLVWVSPKEALRRFNAGIMDMPTPNLMLMSELDAHVPLFKDVQDRLRFTAEPALIVPELVHDEETKMATVLLPGDIHHSETEANLIDSGRYQAQKGVNEEDSEEGTGSNEDTSKGENGAYQPKLRRFQFIKDEPWGVRAVFTDRPILASDDLTPLVRTPDKVVEIEDGILEAEVDAEAEEEAKLIATRAQNQRPSRRLPALSMIDEQERDRLGLPTKPSEIEDKAKKKPEEQVQSKKKEE